MFPLPILPPFHSTLSHQGGAKRTSSSALVPAQDMEGVGWARKRVDASASPNCSSCTVVLRQAHCGCLIENDPHWLVFEHLLSSWRYCLGKRCGFGGGMSLAVGFEVSKRLKPFTVYFIVCGSGYELSTTASAMLICLWPCSPSRW